MQSSEEESGTEVTTNNDAAPPPIADRATLQGLQIGVIVRGLAPEPRHRAGARQRLDRGGDRARRRFCGSLAGSGADRV